MAASGSGEMTPSVAERYQQMMQRLPLAIFTHDKYDLLCQVTKVIRDKCGPLLRGGSPHQSTVHTNMKSLWKTRKKPDRALAIE